MRTVGVRELQQNAAAVLRDVERGEPVEVTDRRRRVAWLVPATTGSALDALEASGRLRRAESDLLALGEPLSVRRNVELPSQRLKRMRAGER